MDYIICNNLEGARHRSTNNRAVPCTQSVATVAWSGTDAIDNGSYVRQ